MFRNQLTRAAVRLATRVPLRKIPKIGHFPQNGHFGHGRWRALARNRAARYRLGVIEFRTWDFSLRPRMCATEGIEIFQIANVKSGENEGRGLFLGTAMIVAAVIIALVFYSLINNQAEVIDTQVQKPLWSK